MRYCSRGLSHSRPRRRCLDGVPVRHRPIARAAGIEQHADFSRLPARADTLVAHIFACRSRRAPRGVRRHDGRWHAPRPRVGRVSRLRRASVPRAEQGRERPRARARRRDGAVGAARAMRPRRTRCSKLAPESTSSRRRGATKKTSVSVRARARRAARRDCERATRVAQAALRTFTLARADTRAKTNASEARRQQAADGNQLCLIIGRVDPRDADLPARSRARGRTSRRPK